MSANTGKDQPPPYTSKSDQTLTAGGSAGPSTAPNIKGYHSTCASELLLATSESTCTTSRYLELTFPVMIRCYKLYQPVVLAIDEDYKTLLDDLNKMFIEATPMERLPGSKGITHMAVSLEKTGAQKLETDPYTTPGNIDITPGNITAMLRFVKSRNCRDYINIY